MDKNINIKSNEYYRIFNDCISMLSKHLKNMISEDMVEYMYEHSIVS